MALPPTLAGDLWLGSLRAMRRDRMALLLRASQAGDVVSLRFPGLRAVLVSHPELVKQVLIDNHRAFGKQTRGYDAMRLALGQGLVTAEGDFWRRQRRIAQPAFHRRRIADFAEKMTAATADMLAAWERGPQEIDVAEQLMRLTLRIVGECLCSTDLSDESGAVGRSLTTLLHHVIDRITAPISIPLEFPTPTNLRLRRAIGDLDRVVSDIIEQRRRHPDQHGDLLDMLMGAEDEETGERMSDRQLRDEVLTIVLAGHETTANALSWAFYLLSRFPEIAHRVQLEVAAALGPRDPTMEDLAALPYTEAVIKEAMRLYPPAWLIARSIAEPVTIGDYDIRPGTIVFICPFTLHRDERFWPNPEGFQPERFMGDAERTIPRCAYIPFLAGPRQCIGAGFAMMEAQIILAMVARRFSLDLVPGHPVSAQPTVTLRPARGIRMRLRPRPAPPSAGEDLAVENRMKLIGGA